MRACRPLLGTYVDIRIDGDDHPGAMNEAMNAAFTAVERVQSLMSVFDTDSDIARLNRLGPGQSLLVHPWTDDVLNLAREIMQDSGGLFDCGVATHLAAWGLLPEHLRSEDAKAGTSSMAKLQRVAPQRWQASAAVRIDLGGIAKGFAVDQAVLALQAAGVRSGLVNAGGDLRVFGEAEEPICLRDPMAPEHLHLAGHLRDGACATSATYFSRREHEGKEVSALVNPLSGAAMRTRASFTVVAPSCAVADALTKVLALSGDAAHPCFMRHDAHPIILEPQEARHGALQT